MMRVRILRGIMAHALNQLIIAALRIGTVPVLISTWGAERYGIWVILFTVPSYAALSDFGFVTAAANDMTMSVAQGRRDVAVCTFQSTWLIVLGLMTVLFGACLAITLTAPSSWLPGMGMASETEIRLTIVCLLLYAIASICGGIVLAGYRCSGHYALGIALYAVMTLGEGLALIAAVFVSHQFVAGALALFMGRCGGVTLMALRLRGMEKWLRFGYRSARIAEIRRLARPSLAGMAIPVASAIYLQGMVIVVGAILGAGAVAVFSVVRTLTRLGFQAAANVNLTVMPEFSAASAQRDAARKARLFAFSVVACAGITTVAAVVIIFGGQPIIRIWTRGHIVPDQKFLFLMCVVMVLNTVWFFTSNLLLAVNRHGSYSGVYLIASIATVIVAIPMSKAMGMNGAALALVLLELVMIVHVHRVVFRVGLVDWRMVGEEVRQGVGTILRIRSHKSGA